MWRVGGLRLRGTKMREQESGRIRQHAAVWCGALQGKGAIDTRTLNTRQCFIFMMTKKYCSFNRGGPMRDGKGTGRC